MSTNQVGADLAFGDFVIDRADERVLGPPTEADFAALHRFRELRSRLDRVSAARQTRSRKSSMAGCARLQHFVTTCLSAFGPPAGSQSPQCTWQANTATTERNSLI